ncbi:alpha/beta fold hydrolase [Kitasatospora sp. NPDC088346]|uniref:alpha/beta fold hydrolase n=1 Tax=Kitasatospora sp. NPDC088346 TaxID=3364073 RepID=UPI00380CF257
MPRSPGDPVILRVGGLPLHVLREGSGPVCVLSSGLGGCWFDWDPVVPLLTPRRTVVRFDRPGYGLSAPSDGPPALAAEADRIGQVLTALGLTGRCTVVGHSLAAFHVEAFARLHPRRTDALVLLDGSVEHRPRPARAPELRDLAARASAAALTAVALPYLLGPAARRAGVRMASVRGREDVPAALVRRCYRPGRVLRSVLRENTAYRDTAAELVALRERLPLPGARVTVVAADRRGGAAGAVGAAGPGAAVRQRELAAVLGGEFRTVGPAGHLLMLDRPGEVAAAILGEPDAG